MQDQIDNNQTNGSFDFQFLENNTNPDQSNQSPLSAQDITTMKNYDEQMLMSVFYIAIALLLASIYRELSKKIFIPYSTLVIVTAYVLDKYRDYIGFIGQSAYLFSVIHPYVSLLLYVPLAVFEPLFNADWHQLKRQLKGIVILGGPGVVISILFIATFFQIVLNFQSELSWYGALIIGSVLSCTDPSEVMLALRGSGYSSRYNNLLDIECRLNAGVALLFLQIFISLEKIDYYSSINDPTYHFLSPTRNILQHLYFLVSGIVGGGLLGLIFGLIFCKWLARIVRDEMLSAWITLSMVYLMHYLCEFTVLKISGLVGMIVMGMFMSSIGKTKIYPESEATVKLIWKFFGTCITVMALNTAGVKMANQLTNQEMDWIHWALIPLVWMSMIMARFTVVFILKPWLDKAANIGRPITFNEAVIYAFGGVKGGFCINMCMMIFVDLKIPQRHKQIMIFYIQGVVMTSQLIQILIARFLVKKLLVTKQPKIRQKIFQSTMNNYLKMIENKQQELKYKPQLLFAKWEDVNQLIKYYEIQINIRNLNLSINSQIQQQQQSDLKQQQQSIENNVEPLLIQEDNENQITSDLYSDNNTSQETDQDIRVRLITIIKGQIQKKYLNGELCREAMRLIDEACNIELDESDTPLTIWNKLHQLISGEFKLDLLQKLYQLSFLNQKFIFIHLSFVCEAATSLIFCMEDAQSFKEDCLQLQLNPISVEKIVNELMDQKAQAEIYIAEINQQFSGIVEVIHTKLAVKILLQTQTKYLQEQLKKGNINQLDYDNLRQQIDRKTVNIDNDTISALQQHSQKFSNMNNSQENSTCKVSDYFWSLLAQYPVFNCLDRDQFASLQIAFQAKGEVHFKKGTYIYTQGSKIQYIYVVVQGSVEEQFMNSQFRLYRNVGSILSFANLINHQQIAVNSAMALTDITVMCLSYDTLRMLADSNIKFSKKAKILSIYYWVQLNLERAGPMSKQCENVLIRIAENSDFIENNTDQSIECQSLQNGGYVLQGSVFVENQLDIEISQFSYLQPTKMKIIINKNSQILLFKEPIDNLNKVKEQNLKN